MKKLKFSLFLIAIVAFSMGSCKKDKTVTELLTDSAWKITALSVDPAIDIDGNGTLVKDLYAQYETCDKDDLTIFKAGGVLTNDEGALKCDSSNPQTTTGTWLLSADEKTITFDGDSWSILSLDDATLKMTNVQDDGNGIKYTISATLSH
jgi:hypothetical protein